MNSLLHPKASLWTFSFRPFFLGTALHAIVAILVWIFILFFGFSFPNITGNIQFHSYEMVFGFSRAAILGFLFTAAQNWTKTVILKEKSLILLFLLWITGRFGFSTNLFVSTISFTGDLLCDIIALYFLAPPLLKKGQNHNRIIVIVYSVFFLIHLLSVLSLLGRIPFQYSLHFIHISIFVILFLILIIAGRILPFFTSVAVPGAFPKKFQGLEDGVQYLGLLFLILEFALFWFPNFSYLSGGFCFFYSLAICIRWFFWEPWKTIKTPILLILHLGYFWIVVGFIAYGLYRIGFFPSVSSAYHILTTGGIGVFVYGMITRVSLGHTGRPIRASKLTVFGYVCMNLAVLSRGFLPLTGYNREAYILSAFFWIGSFLLFLVQYAGILTKARADQ